MLKFLISMFLIIATAAGCDKSNDCETEDEPNQKQIVAQGNIYNHCDPGSFYILLDSMMLFTSDLPLDSMFSPNWLGYINNAENLMVDLYQDSTNADLKIWYLQNAQLEYEILNPNLSVVPTTFSIDTLISDSYPFYGAITINRGNQEILLMVLNRYVGGCLHDEMVWQMSE